MKASEIAPTLPAEESLTLYDAAPPLPKSQVELNFPPPPDKTISQKGGSIKRHESFEGVMLRLKKLSAFVDATGEQTFYISDVEYDSGEFVHAYWKQKNAIIVLQLPVYGEPTKSDLFWLSGKAYTDLNKDVVPKELGNMGCCLVTKARAEKIVKASKRGYKLKFNVEAQAK